MKIIVAVDANILLSALLGGKPSFILFDGKFQFVTTKFTLEEVKKYLPRLEKKIGVSKEELLSLLEDLPIKTYNRNFYRAN
jgi:predicted nucleic acid-binding protein